MTMLSEWHKATELLGDVIRSVVAYLDALELNSHPHNFLI
jgi:hypothetical protein